MIESARFESDTVTDIHTSVFEYCRETIVVIIVPCYIIKKVHTLVGIVLVKSFLGVGERYTVAHHMCPGRLVECGTACRTSSAELESIAVAGRFCTVAVNSGIPCITIVYQYRMVHHVEVPVVIAVVPCTASVKFGARSREQFARESVGITAVIRACECHGIIIIV